MFEAHPCAAELFQRPTPDWARPLLRSVVFLSISLTHPQYTALDAKIEPIPPIFNAWGGIFYSQRQLKRRKVSLQGIEIY